MDNVPSAGATALDAWIGRTVRVLAAMRGMRLQTVAAHIGVAPSSLSGKLKGTRPWSAKEVMAAADLFDIDVSRLYDGYGGYVPPPSGLDSRE